MAMPFVAHTETEPVAAHVALGDVAPHLALVDETLLGRSLLDVSPALGVLPVEAFEIEAPDLSGVADWPRYCRDEVRVLEEVLSHPGTDLSHEDIGRLFPEWLGHKGRKYVTDKLLRRIKKDEVIGSQWGNNGKTGRARRYRYEPAVESVDTKTDTSGDEAVTVGTVAVADCTALVVHHEAPEASPVLVPDKAAERVDQQQDSAAPGETEVPLFNVADEAEAQDDVSGNEAVTVLPGLPGVLVMRTEPNSHEPTLVVGEGEIETQGLSDETVAAIAVLSDRPMTFEQLCGHLKALGFVNYPTSVHRTLANVRKTLDRQLPGYGLHERSVATADGIGDIVLNIGPLAEVNAEED